MDRIEQEHAGSLQVVRVDIQSEVGQELAMAYRVNATPTFILFDAQGKESWRGIGSISPERVSEALSQ